MDPSNESQLDISKLTESDKHELSQILNAEMQKAKIHEAIHSLTDICFSKCVTGKISSGRLERGEDTCVQNCVERFMDANDSVIKHLENMRGNGTV